MPGIKRLICRERKTPLIGCRPFTVPEVPEKIRERLERREFIRRYRAVYGQEPETAEVEAAMAYRRERRQR